MRAVGTVGNIDWRAPFPPPGYIPGISRGAVAIRTSVELSSFAFAATNSLPDEVAEELQLFDELATNPLKKARREANANDPNRALLSKFDSLKDRIREMKPAERDTLVEIGVAVQRTSREPTAGSSKSGIAGTMENFYDPRQLLQVEHSSTTTLLPPCSPHQLHSNDPSSVADASSSTGGRVISDSAKAVLRERINANPLEPDNWIRLARALHSEGKDKSARSVLLDGCRSEAGSKSDRSELLWLEAMKQEFAPTPQERRTIAEESVSRCPQSERLWLHLASVQSLDARKLEVLRDAVTNLPEREQLWLALLEEEEPSDHADIIKEALKACPRLPQLWIRLAYLESSSNGLRLLNRGIAENPNSVEMWLAAARHEEERGDRRNVSIIIQRAAATKAFTLQQWLAAVPLQLPEHPLTCKAILCETFNPSQSSTWREDMLSLLASQLEVSSNLVLLVFEIVCFDNAVKPDASLFASACKASINVGGAAALSVMAEKVIQLFPDDAFFYHQTGKLLTSCGDVQSACAILRAGTQVVPTEHCLWIALAKAVAHAEEGLKGAKIVLEQACQRCNSPKVYAKRVILLVQNNEFAEALRVTDEGLTLFPRDSDLWSWCIHLNSRHTANDARNATRKALDLAGDDVATWIHAANAEAEVQRDFHRARDVLERGLFRHPRCEELWVHRAYLELSISSKREAALVVSRGLSQCVGGKVHPKLIALSIDFGAPSTRPRRARDVVQNLCGGCEVLLAISRIYMQAGELLRAVEEAEKAVKLQPRNGDAWATLFKVVTACGDHHQAPTSLDNIVSRAQTARPKVGYHWTRVAKCISNVTLHGSRKSMRKLLEDVSAQLPSD